MPLHHTSIIQAAGYTHDKYLISQSPTALFFAHIVFMKIKTTTNEGILTLNVQHFHKLTSSTPVLYNTYFLIDKLHISI